jgi:protein involved in polysaccharide export with SLBB domain
MRLTAFLVGLLMVAQSLPAADRDKGGTTDTNALVAVDILDDTVKLNTGVQLTYRVKEDKDPAVRLVVTDTGEIDVPYLGRVKAIGKTCKQLAGEVKALLEKDLYHTATVTIAVDSVSVFNLKEVTVQGQVARPGPVTIPPGGEDSFTLSKAIFAAGGTTLYAKSSNVKIIRQPAPGSNEPPQTIYIDFDDIVKKGKKENDILIKPGDTIIVDRKNFVF